MALEMYLSLPFQCWSQRAHCPAQLLRCPASTWDVGVWTQVFILVLQPLNPLSHIAALLPPPLLHPSLYLLPLFLRFYDMFMSNKNSREASAQMSPRKSMDPATPIMNSVLLHPWKKRARRKESDPLGGDLCILGWQWTDREACSWVHWAWPLSISLWCPWPSLGAIWW